MTTPDRVSRGQSSGVSAAIRAHPLTAYFALAYAISWVGVLPLVLSARGVLPQTVPPSLHALGALGPFAAAFAVAALTGGREGARRLAARFGRRQARAGWIAVAVLSPFALLAAALAIDRLATGAWPPIDPALRAFRNPAWTLDLAIASVVYGFGEETGWRGFALPRLQARHGALVATTILALLWAAWHAPFFFYRFDFGGIGAAVGFFVAILAGAVWLTVLFNSTGGSVLVTGLWHMCWNVVNLAGGEISTDVVAYMSMLVIVAAPILIVACRPGRLSIWGPPVRES